MRQILGLLVLTMSRGGKNDRPILNWDLLEGSSWQNSSISCSRTDYQKTIDLQYKSVFYGFPRAVLWCFVIVLSSYWISCGKRYVFKHKFVFIHFCWFVNTPRQEIARLPLAKRMKTTFLMVQFSHESCFKSYFTGSYGVAIYSTKFIMLSKGTKQI